MAAALRIVLQPAVLRTRTAACQPQSMIQALVEAATWQPLPAWACLVAPTSHRLVVAGGVPALLSERCGGWAERRKEKKQ